MIPFDSDDHDDDDYNNYGDYDCDHHSTNGPQILTASEYNIFG